MQRSGHRSNKKSLAAWLSRKGTVTRQVDWESVCQAPMLLPPI